MQTLLLYYAKLCSLFGDCDTTRHYLKVTKNISFESQTKTLILGAKINF